MHRLSALVAVYMLAGISLPLAAIAQSETLTYTGNPFNQATFSGNLSLAEANAPTMDTGTVVLSTPLGDNLNDVFVTPESYAFGGSVLASYYLNSGSPVVSLYGNSAAFEFSTNAFGMITQWNVDVTGGIFEGTNSPSGAAITLGMSGDTYSAFTSSPSCAAPPGVPISCYSVSESNVDSNSFYSAAGHWQQTINQTPEIDTGMAGSGLTLLAGVLAIVRGRRRAAA
jgi:hypothetical protein